jgi:hypothetical protein
MTHRKGELSAGRIDREWPHQVAMRADQTMGKNHDIIHEFCRGLSLSSRGHTVRRGDIVYRVFCFADAAHAERFCESRRALRSEGSRSRQRVVPLAQEPSRPRRVARNKRSAPLPPSHHTNPVFASGLIAPFVG